MEKFDVVIVGGGILGSTLSYWLSSLYEGKIAVLEMEQEVAHHTSGRNTGVIHRPFYLNPERRKVFARSAQISYRLWKEYAALRGLPWKEIGTIEVATKKEELPIIEKYLKWAKENGMTDQEVQILNSQEVKKIEPEVECAGALYCKSDASVDYKIFTESIKKEAIAQGVQFLFGFKVKEIRVELDHLKISSQDSLPPIEARTLINCAGGNAVDLAHELGIGMEYTDLHFRGEYWEIDPKVRERIKTNIYSVPRHAELPFLDPHWIVRADGARQIGPNAVLIAGAYCYSGFFNSLPELIGKILEKPLSNKLKLLINKDFIRLASEEWKSSLSKKEMLRRVQRFIPFLKEEHLIQRGIAGIRSSCIDSQGNFIKEAIELEGPNSYHILNYNSPGATGSPAYTALLAKKLQDKGYLSHLKKKQTPNSFWNFSEIIAHIGN